MSLYITSLNSGSNGNCYYAGNETEAVLIDVGISCKEVEQRMKRLGLDMSRVKAIFISHEHTDHIRGVPVLAAKYKLPVYVTSATLRGSRYSLGKNTFISFNEGQSIEVGDIEVTPFIKYHDAAEPHSFVLSHKETVVGVMTDIGRVCDRTKEFFSRCHAVFLEANYDEEMLEKGRYPCYLKKRIRGGHGHLSNREALDLFTGFRSPGLQLLILSHLSKENNCPNLVQAYFTREAGDVRIVVASRYKETEVFHIKGQECAVSRPVKHFTAAPAQMSLF